MAVVASRPPMSLATPSLIATREPISPAKRWPKKAAGSRRTWQKKRLERAERQLGLEAQQVVALQPGQHRLDGDGRGHEPEQRPDDPLLAADQDSRR